MMSTLVRHVTSGRASGRQRTLRWLQLVEAHDIKDESAGVTRGFPPWLGAGTGLEPSESVDVFHATRAVDIPREFARATRPLLAALRRQGRGAMRSWNFRAAPKWDLSCRPRA